MMMDLDDAVRTRLTTGGSRREPGLRVRQRVVSTPVWYYKDTANRRSVTIIGTYPTGERDYYAALRAVLDQAESGGTRIHYERGLAVSPDDTARARRVEREVIALLQRAEALETRRADVLGWTTRRAALRAGESWIPHEQSYLTLIHRTGLSWVRSRAREAVAICDWPDGSRRGPAMYQLVIGRTIRLQTRDPSAVDHHTVLYHRAVQAIEAVNSTNGDVAVAWDATVLPQIAARITQMPNLVRQRVDWLRVGRLPQRGTVAARWILGIGRRHPATTGPQTPLAGPR